MIATAAVAADGREPLMAPTPRAETVAPVAMVTTRGRRRRRRRGRRRYTREGPAFLFLARSLSLSIAPPVWR